MTIKRFIKVKKHTVRDTAKKAWDNIKKVWVNFWYK
jgi:hypothetical protein